MNNNHAIIFVHFSNFIDNYLIQSIAITRLNSPDARIILISDNQKYIKHINKYLVVFKHYPKPLNKLALNYYNNHHPLEIRTRDGFWLKSVIRLIALFEFSSLNPELSITHLESDSFLTSTYEQVVEWFSHLDHNMYLPVNSVDEVVPSLMYLNNGHESNKYLEYINEIFLSNLKIDEFFLSDQKILALLLNRFDEISPFPNFESTHFVDPAFLGQFIFGLDPRHNNFILKSGYVRDNSDIEFLRDVVFQTNNLQNPLNTSIVINDSKTLKIINLHNHAKFNNINQSKFITDWPIFLANINKRKFPTKISLASIESILKSKTTSLFKKFSCIF
jgi:hypothetical protein